MKREVSFKDKIRVLINFLKWLRRKEDAGLVAVCSCCGSTKVKKSYSDTDSTQRDIVKYRAMYECLNCKSKATCEEVWHKPEEYRNEEN